MEHRWTIHELAAALDLAIRLAPQNGQASGRVRAVPDQRTIRYYNTLGMVDRPDMVGRTAYYNQRHLWQLLAIKRLQSGGDTLVEVQQKLAGASDSQLRKLAALPEGFWQSYEQQREREVAARVFDESASAPATSTPGDVEIPAAVSAAPRAAAFWMAEPVASVMSVAAPAAEHAAQAGGSVEFCAASPADAAQRGPSLALRPAVHVALTDEMTLVLEGTASVQFAHLSPAGRQRLAELAGQIAEVLAREHPAGHDVHLVHQPPPQGNADSGASSV